MSELLTVQDLARESGLAEVTIRVAMAKGRFPVVELYGRRLVRRSDWEAYRRQAKPGRPRKHAAADA